MIINELNSFNEEVLFLLHAKLILLMFDDLKLESDELNELIKKWKTMFPKR